MTATSMCPMTGMTMEYNAEGAITCIREFYEFGEGRLIRITDASQCVTQLVYDQPELTEERP